MKILLVFLAVMVGAASAQAVEVFDLNVFDQLQGKWQPDLREKRLAAVADFVKKRKPEIVVFQEAKGVLPGDKQGGGASVDAKLLESEYPYRKYVYEMTGADGGAYGYWMGAKVKPTQWIEDGFYFPGGVKRRVQAALFSPYNGSCLGVLSLHLSYQTSAVRVKEAHWLLDWLKGKESLCKHWLVLGDFNAEAKDPEIKTLFQGGLKPLYKKFRPTVGAYNPIRQVYGKDVPSQTIDWALGWNLKGSAQVVLDKPWKGQWVSDHAGVLVHLQKSKK